MPFGDALYNLLVYYPTFLLLCTPAQKGLPAVTTYFATILLCGRAVAGGGIPASR